MERRELSARVLALLMLVGLPMVLLGYQFGLRPALAPHRVIDIRAAAPEAGGFQPASVRVEAGETVTLRFAAEDVTHGIAIGPGLGVDLGHLDPGEVREVTLTFDDPGTFTFYCNTWCSKDHWRMRGVIEVRDSLNPENRPPVQSDPVIEALLAEGVDIDAVHNMGDESDGQDQHADHGDSPRFRSPPSAERGALLVAALDVPAQLTSAEWRRSHTPNEAIELLVAVNLEQPVEALADVVLYLWMADLPAGPASDTRDLYDKNCAACHGQQGRADGPAADTTAEFPPAFSDAEYMFDMRSDVLYAKIRRGGMGTDMPNFGTLFTSQETWALVDYLWSLNAAAGSDPDSN